MALAGCGLGNGPGSLLVDPGRYEAYHCNDLVARWKHLTDREKDLRALMDKASQSGTGAVIGAVAYRSDYESVLTAGETGAARGRRKEMRAHHHVSERPVHPLTDRVRQRYDAAE